VTSWVKDFANPSAAYRGKPFWAWNGRLEPEELRRQIRLMHQMGLGGFFMHSRVGLATPYLSGEWFDCIRACVDEARSLGMEAWLYDEDRWPSGAAGGLVTKDPKYRMIKLQMTRTRSTRAWKWDADTLAVFTAHVDGHDAFNVRPLKRGQKPRRLAGDETFLVFHIVPLELMDWFNGQTYLDTLGHEAVRKFIDVTHEAYRRQVGEEFGRTVPGIFTDEPHHDEIARALGDRREPTMPWTRKFPVVFRKRYGYDLLTHLPELFFNVDAESMHPARYHYHDCLTHLFCDAFARQIGQWCEKNNLLFTGHTLAEATLSHQVSVSATMRFYEHMQAPGMDLLCEINREYDTAKQVSSVARQFGRRWRLTETYGCTGWDFPLAAHKALGDWQVALGINLRCQHLSWYTMEGQAKRDYPASIFYQSPWWSQYGKVEDYFARIHAAMTCGREVRDLLVLHPVESMWMLFHVDWKKDSDRSRYDEMLVRLRDSLLAANLDFDYADEDILARHGRLRKAGPTLFVGQAEYKAVLVPPLKTMRRTTVELLRRFAQAGGTVVFAGEPPRYVEAVPSDDPVALAARCAKAPAHGPKLAAAVEGAARRISILDEHDKQIVPALHLLREDKKAFYLFVCNVGHDFTRPGRHPLRDPRVKDRVAEFKNVRIVGFGECKGAPVELDPDTGETFAADAKRVKGQWCIRTFLPKLGSRLFVIPKRPGKAVPPRKPLRDVRRRVLRSTRWDVTLSECNNLVLDRPRFRVDHGPWQKADEVLRVDRKIRETVGLKPRGGSMKQPWAETRRQDCQPKEIELAYTFQVRTPPGGDLHLALERPELYHVEINGHELPMDLECGWWVDRSLRKLPVDPLVLKPGRNEVRLRCRYDARHPGLEILYLLGDFGVRVVGTETIVTAPVRTLALGDWVKQDLPFYSGSVAYRKTVSNDLRKGQRLFVRVPDYRGVGVRVLVNGCPAGVIAWEPNEVEITSCLQTGPNQLAIEVLGHRRNSHGPLHNQSKWPAWTGPAEFLENYQENFSLVPCGLMTPPQLIVR